MTVLYDFGYNEMITKISSLVISLICSLELVAYSSLHGMVFFPLCSMVLGGFTAYEAEHILGLFSTGSKDALYTVIILLVFIPLHFLIADRGMAQSERLIGSLRKAGSCTKENVLCSYATMFMGIAAYVLLTVYILKI